MDDDGIEVLRLRRQVAELRDRDAWQVAVIQNLRARLESLDPASALSGQPEADQ